MKTLIMVCLIWLCVSPAWGSWDEWEGEDQPPITQPDAEWKKPGNFLSEFGQMLEGLARYRSGQRPLSQQNGGTFLGPITPNAYGPGINSDATGRPFTWQPDHGSGGGQLRVTPDAYGPGVGMDQYGRSVRPKSWP